MTPATVALIAALRCVLGDFKVVRAHSADWQSLTFLGERHELEIELPPENLPRLDRLGEGEFCLPGNILADIGVVGTPVGNRARLEALTVVA